MWLYGTDSGGIQRKQNKQQISRLKYTPFYTDTPFPPPTDSTFLRIR
jgi:hypothetical protein